MTADPSAAGGITTPSGEYLYTGRGRWHQPREGVVVPVDLTAGVREAARRRADREAVEALAAAVHTTVEVWATPQGYTIELGRAVRLTVDPRAYALARNPFDMLVSVCRSRWRRYTPDIPPNVELGTE